MSFFDPEVFFQLHADLPREGPGETADVAWAAEVAGVKRDAQVLDAACGPGGDLGGLLRAAPDGHVVAVDHHAPFIDAAKARWGEDRRVTLTVGDMLTEPGPFQFIWCAGAVYFVGIETALPTWKDALAPGGAIAFSEPCYFTETPSEGARAFWDGEGLSIGTEANIRTRVADAGFEVRATRALSPIAWESYYRPMEARIERLRPGANAALMAVLEDAEREIANWRAHQAETGYLLLVAQPK